MNEAKKTGCMTQLAMFLVIAMVLWVVSVMILSTFWLFEAVL